MTDYFIRNNNLWGFIMVRHKRICFIVLLIEWCHINVTITLGTILPSLTIYILILGPVHCDSYNGAPSFCRVSTLCPFFLPHTPLPFLERTGNRNSSAHRFMSSSIFVFHRCILWLHLYWWERHQHKHRLSEIERFDRGKVFLLWSF